jgi:hypothetical protein
MGEKMSNEQFEIFITPFAVIGIYLILITAIYWINRFLNNY